MQTSSIISINHSSLTNSQCKSIAYFPLYFSTFTNWIGDRWTNWHTQNKRRIEPENMLMFYIACEIHFKTMFSIKWKPYKQLLCSMVSITWNMGWINEFIQSFVSNWYVVKFNLISTSTWYHHRTCSLYIKSKKIAENLFFHCDCRIVFGFYLSYSECT